MNTRLLMLPPAVILLLLSYLFLDRADKIRQAIRQNVFEPWGYEQVTRHIIADSLVLKRIDRTKEMGGAGKIPTQVVLQIEEKIGPYNFNDFAWVAYTNPKIVGADTVDRFIESSYLAQDRMLPELFELKLEDGSSTMIPIKDFLPSITRRIYLPFSDYSRWMGRIEYRNTSIRPLLRYQDLSRKVIDYRFLYPMLTTNDNKIRFQPIMKSVNPYQNDEDFEAARYQFRFREVKVFDAVALPGDNHEINAFIYLNIESGQVVRINGKLFQGRAIFHPLRDGDVIGVNWGIEMDGYKLRYLKKREGVISSMQLSPKGLTRVVDPRFNIESLAYPLQAVMEIIIEKGYQFSRLAAQSDAPNSENEPADEDCLELLQNANVRLTLNANIQAKAQFAVIKMVNKAKTKLPGVPQKNAPRGFQIRKRYLLPPQKAGIGIIDISTGEVLAMASYPDNKAVEDLKKDLKKLADTISDKNPEREKRRKEAAMMLYDYLIDRTGQICRNQNLENHPIGSVFKPIWAMAYGMTPALQKPEDDILALTVKGHNDCKKGISGEYGGDCSTYEGGLNYGHSYERFNHQHNVNLEKFLASSCNRFLFDTGGRALRGLYGTQFEPPTSSENRLCNNNNLMGSGLFMPDHIFEQFSLLYDVQYMSPEPSEKYSANCVDSTFSYHSLSLMRMLPQWIFKGCCEADEVMGNRLVNLKSLMPQNVNLRVRAINRCYPDYSSFLYGAFHNRWSNIELLQTFARIVGGEKTWARYVDDIYIDNNEKGVLTRQSLWKQAPQCFPVDYPDELIGKFEPLISKKNQAKRKRFNELRTRILWGMGNGMGGGGTSASIQKTLRKVQDKLKDETGIRFGFHAKTGSADRYRSVVDFNSGRWTRLALKDGNHALIMIKCQSVEPPSLPKKSTRSLAGLGCFEEITDATPIQGAVIIAWSEFPSEKGKGGTAGPRLAKKLYNSSEGKSLLLSVGRYIAEMEEARQQETTHE